MVDEEYVKVSIHISADTYYKGDVFMTRARYDRLNKMLSSGDQASERAAEAEVWRIGLSDMRPANAVRVVTFVSRDDDSAEDVDE